MNRIIKKLQLPVAAALLCIACTSCDGFVFGNVNVDYNDNPLSGKALARSGAVGSRDMTLEATYAKVQFLLSQGLRGPELAAWMGRSIAGELTQ